jgi:hypothetical protein
MPILQMLEQEQVIQIPSVQEQQKNQIIPQLEQEPVIQIDQWKPGHHYFFQTNQSTARVLESFQSLQMQERVQVAQIHLSWQMIRMPMVVMRALEHQTHRRRELVPSRNQIQKMTVQPQVEIQMVWMMPVQMQEFAQMNQKELRLGLQKETIADQTCFSS